MSPAKHAALLGLLTMLAAGADAAAAGQFEAAAVVQPGVGPRPSLEGVELHRDQPGLVGRHAAPLYDADTLGRVRGDRRPADGRSRQGAQRTPRVGRDQRAEVVRTGGGEGGPGPRDLRRKPDRPPGRHDPEHRGGNRPAVRRHRLRPEQHGQVARRCGREPQRRGQAEAAHRDRARRRSLYGLQAARRQARRTRRRSRGRQSRGLGRLHGGAGRGGRRRVEHLDRRHAQRHGQRLFVGPAHGHQPRQARPGSASTERPRPASWPTPTTRPST